MFGRLYSRVKPKVLLLARFSQLVSGGCNANLIIHYIKQDQYSLAVLHLLGKNTLHVLQGSVDEPHFVADFKILSQANKAGIIYPGSDKLNKFFVNGNRNSVGTKNVPY